MHEQALLHAVPIPFHSEPSERHRHRQSIVYCWLKQSTVNAKFIWTVLMLYGNGMYTYATEINYVYLMVVPEVGRDIGPN